MSPLPGGALPVRRRVKTRGLGSELAELERTNPAVALAADELDRVTSKIIGRSVPSTLPGGALPPRENFMTRNREAVARARREKARREAEAVAWMVGVRARKAGKR